MAPSPIARPFAGLRYARSDLSGVLAPPYDVIGPEERERLLGRDPHNVVRLELGYARAAEAPANDRYQQAAATLRQWRAAGVLVYDEGPCLYPCAHEFTVCGRMLTRVGVMCAVRLTPFERRLVLPHEGTLRGPREDRQRLMLACQAQISPVLALHDDTTGAAMELIRDMMRAEPVAHGQTGDDRHRLWRRPSDELAARYCALVGQGPLYIADGHHRYETALAVSQELRRAYPQATPDAAFDHVLVLLCPAQQPGIVILPTHRLLRLRSAQEWERLGQLVERHFTRQPLACDASDPLPAARTLVRHLEQPDRGATFGMYTRRDGCALLLPRDEVMPPEAGPGGYEELATVLIHRLLVDEVVGSERLAEQVDYATDEAEAVRLVSEGRFDCALFLRPTTVEQMRRVASAGLRMPGKSTYFYPKAPTGLVISDISPQRTIP